MVQWSSQGEGEMIIYSNKLEKDAWGEQLNKNFSEDNIPNVRAVRSKLFETREEFI